MEIFEAGVYLLCLITSVICMGLLARGYAKSGVKLLLWSALGFVGFAFNNLFLFLDLVTFPDINLLPYRNATALAGMMILYYGLVWEAD